MAVSWFLFALAALLFVAAAWAVMSPVSIASSTQIVDNLETGGTSRTSTGVSCRAPVVDMWNGSHEREAVSYRLPPEYCRGHSRFEARSSASIAAAAIGIAALGWAVGRRRREPVGANT